MQKILTVILFISIWVKSDMSFAQSDSIKIIEKMTDLIDDDPTLKSKEFDANEVYNTSFDGGGRFCIFYDGKFLHKIIPVKGASKGIRKNR